MEFINSYFLAGHYPCPKGRLLRAQLPFAHGAFLPPSGKQYRRIFVNFSVALHIFLAPSDIVPGGKVIVVLLGQNTSTVEKGLIAFLFLVLALVEKRASIHPH
jgi:hypothetical protein